MVTKTLSFLLSLLIFLSSCAGSAAFDSSTRLPLARNVIALLPFENLSGKKDATEEVMLYVRQWFEKAGFEVAPEAAVERFLSQREIRNTGRLSDTTIQHIASGLGVTYVLLGNVILFSEDPALSISARLVSVPAGDVIWGGHASRCGDEFKTVLGLGKIKTLKELAPMVMDELFSPCKRFAPPDNEKRERWPFRMAVMPFENFSTRKDAGIIVTYLFLSGIAQKPGWETVEYGKVWNALVSENYPYRGELDYDTLQALGKKLGVDGIMLGTVEKYREGFGTKGQVIPEVAISLRLLHVPNKTIIWADRLGATGEDDILVLDWGRIRTADKVAEKIIKKLLQRLPYVKVEAVEKGELIITPAPEIAEKVMPRPIVEEIMPTAEAPKVEALITAEGRSSAGLLPIYFDFDKYNIRSDQISRLDRNAEWLGKNPAAKIRIEGNCDERGSNEYNLALGERRANSAKDYLTNLGMSPERIETLSHGEERPLCFDHNEECWAKNRRDDFVVIER